MKRSILLTLLSGLVLCACNKTERPESPRNFTVEDLVISTELTGHLDTTQYVISKVVPLTGGEDVIIPQYDKLVFQGDKVYILDKSISKRVFVYDTLGNFQYKVGEAGRALNEFYRQPSDFSVDSRGRIYLFDSEGPKIIKYDEQGKYRSTDALREIWPYAFALTDNGDYAFAFRMMDDRTEVTYELAVYDSLEQNKSNYRPLADHQLFTYDIPFWSSEDKLYYIPNMSDTVFVLSGDTISRAIHLDFQGKFLPDEAVAEVQRTGELSKIARKHEGAVLGAVKYEENEHWIHVEYSIGIGLNYLKNKQTGEIHEFVSLFEGFFPASQFFICDNFLVYLMTEDSVLGTASMKEEDFWAETYGKTSGAVRKMLDGKTPLPALVYVELK